MNRDQMLKVEIVDGRLEISIGVESLVYAVTYGLEYQSEDFEVVDTDKFAEEIVNALQWEEEDGSTVLYRAFDKAALDAIEQGAHGIEFTDK